MSVLLNNNHNVSFTQQQSQCQFYSTTTTMFYHVVILPLAKLYVKLNTFSCSLPCSSQYLLFTSSHLSRGRTGNHGPHEDRRTSFGATRTQAPLHKFTATPVTAPVAAPPARGLTESRGLVSPGAGAPAPRLAEATSSVTRKPETAGGRGLGHRGLNRNFAIIWNLKSLPIKLL